MNKTPVFTIIALLVVVLIAFSSCEVSIGLNGESNTETSVESMVVTDEEGSTRIETVVHTVTVPEAPVVSVVEVTNKKGEVVETEKITLSPQEIQDGKDFFEVGNVTTTKKSNKVDKDTPETTTKLSNEAASERVTEPSKDNVNVQDDFAVLNSDKYLIEARIVDKEGNSYPYRMARNGNRLSAMIYYNNQEFCLIVGYEYIYIVMPSTKTYMKIAKSVVEDESGDEQLIQDLFSGNGLNLYDNKNKVDSYTEKMHGIKYTVVEYDDGTCDYFNGKTLVKTVASDGSTLYYDVITAEVSEGVFAPPAGYTEQVMDQEALSNVAGSLTTTAVAE